MQLPVREAYCPGHFGNSYEAMWPREMAAYLAEMRHWGFNRLGPVRHVFADKFSPPKWYESWRAVAGAAAAQAMLKEA